MIKMLMISSPVPLRPLLSRVEDNSTDSIMAYVKELTSITAFWTAPDTFVTSEAVMLASGTDDVNAMAKVRLLQSCPAKPTPQELPDAGFVAGMVVNTANGSGAEVEVTVVVVDVVSVTVGLMTDVVVVVVLTQVSHSAKHMLLIMIPK